ncbi:MAG: type IV toxin-antitoxin system AbiEi family antitoxin domain-containing protein [Syntrophales bacterium]
MNTERKLKGNDFFAGHPVFSLDEAAAALLPEGKRLRVVERLKHHLRTGRLKRVTREIYAVVPPILSTEDFHPDPFLVASAMYPDGVFSHHSALELLGAAHSLWNQCTLYVNRRRRQLVLDDATLRFLDLPLSMKGDSGKQVGTRRIERQGKLLEVTGPERTLVEGFSRPSLVGGLEELVNSAAGFTTLDLELLEEVLRRYDTAKLWAATGWFLERFQKPFHVPEALLARMEQRRPRSRAYVERGQRGGLLVGRWNLILPKVLLSSGEPDER